MPRNNAALAADGLRAGKAGTRSGCCAALAELLCDLRGETFDLPVLSIPAEVSATEHIAHAPEGLPSVAQRFSAGKETKKNPSPVGTADVSNAVGVIGSDLVEKEFVFIVR